MSAFGNAPKSAGLKRLTMAFALNGLLSLRLALPVTRTLLLPADRRASRTVSTLFASAACAARRMPASSRFTSSVCVSFVLATLTSPAIFVGFMLP